MVGSSEKVRATKMVLVTGDKLEQAKQFLDRWEIDAEIVTDLKGEIRQLLRG